MEINEIEGRRVGLTTLHSKSGYGDGPITMGGGVYESLNGREEWTGESLDGEIPIKALLEWAVEAGYLKFWRRP
jgi:hypothetical protein